MNVAKNLLVVLSAVVAFATTASVVKDGAVGLGWEDGWVKEWRTPPALCVTETCERLDDGFEKHVRRWEWTGTSPLEQVTLAVRLHVAGDPRALKPFVPGVLMYGNPSNAGRASEEAVPVYAGEKGEFAIFEDHRPPMPFVLVEDVADGAFTVLHTVPSPIRGAKHADQWWSFGVEATDDGADLVLLSGPIGYNRRRSVAKSQQKCAQPYDEAYVTLRPGQIVEKVYYVQTGVAKDGRFGFEFALERCLDLYRPYDASRHPSVSRIARAKRDYAMTRWHDDGAACGFLTHDPASGRKEIVMGWCGCAATCGWALPVLNFDDGDIAKAQRSLDFLATVFIDRIHEDTGLFDVRYDAATKETCRPDPVSCGQGLYSFMKAIRHAAKDPRLDATKWRLFAEKAARAYARQVMRPDWKLPRSTAEGFYVAPLVLAAELFDAPECLAAAERIAGHFEREYFGYDRVYWGGTLDASCEDKEGAYAAFQGYLELLEHAVRTGDKTAEVRYARLARHAMDLMLTYTMVWDASYPPSRLADHAFKSTGWTFVSAQNQHLDAFGVLTAPEVLRMGRYLKDDRLVKLADVMYRSCFQLTSADGSLGEQIQHTNFGQRGKSPTAEGYRGGYSEKWTVFWLTAHFLNAAASFAESSAEVGRR